ncbi:hypothetical protein K402DRAFT_326487 [Aulographum hederae CBS 113979]|uniref:Uncharacterized protein n=1 Tax=Aulographum hederae CBS 113979 TaxID=1176131 RepID=A0A6G1H9B0_9PEZI|nr:hypothetical protein K402DRAFT_326487 [Aulographum hederae CBS 113979]
MHHYVGFYILGLEFRIENVQNLAMDLIRRYYRGANMTAPAYRLEYVYENTDEDNLMRRFLVVTAAYRALCEGRISESVQEVVEKGGPLASDFVKALCGLHGNGLVDVRRGSSCAWHTHEGGAKCPAAGKGGLEPYES